MIASADVDLFAPGAAVVAALTAFRVAGLVLIAPLFAARTVPATVRTGIVLALTVVLLPGATAAARPAAALTPESFLAETLVGFTIGLGAAVLVGAAEVAGDLAGTVIGLSGAQIMDPLGGHASSAMGQFYSLLAATLLLAGNGHLVMLDALGQSLVRVPVGSTLALRDGLGVLVTQGGLLFALGLQVAAPVIAAAMVANIGLGVVTRAVPQLNLMNLAFPVQIGIGLTAIAASLPFLAVVTGGWGEEVRALARTALSTFAGR